jgi:hypothetical protein
MAAEKLTKKELECVINAVQEYLSDLRLEIAHTDNLSYKDGLKCEDATLEAALTKLKARVQAKATA